MQTDPNERDPRHDDGSNADPTLDPGAHAAGDGGSGDGGSGAGAAGSGGSGSRFASGGSIAALVVVIALALAAQRWVLPALGIGGG